MIICDCCGVKVEPGNLGMAPRAHNDPYGEDEHWCKSCSDVYGNIRESVKDRMVGIFDRAVERRLAKWKASMLTVEEVDESGNA